MLTAEPNLGHNAPDDVGLPESIQKRSFAVIDVSHDGDDGLPRTQLPPLLFGRRRARISVVIRLFDEHFRRNVQALKCVCVCLCVCARAFVRERMNE